jgi:hypothetical protein
MLFTEIRPLPVRERSSSLVIRNDQDSISLLEVQHFYSVIINTAIGLSDDKLHFVKLVMSAASEYDTGIILKYPTSRYRCSENT